MPSPPRSIQTRRDKWGHPLVIKKEFERARGIAISDPPRDEPDRPPPNPETAARHRQRNAAAFDEARHQLIEVVEISRENALETAAMLGRRLTPLEYDLSTPQLIQESARNFYEVYGEDDEAILAFAKALQGIVRVHRAEGYHPRRQRSQPAASVEGEAVAEAEAVEAVETAPEPPRPRRRRQNRRHRRSRRWRMPRPPPRRRRAASDTRSHDA